MNKFLKLTSDGKALYLRASAINSVMEDKDGTVVCYGNDFCYIVRETLAEVMGMLEASMIPNGKEMTWNGHHLVFESEPNPCRGCFFADKDECPDCDEGAWVEDNTEASHDQR